MASKVPIAFRAVLYLSIATQFVAATLSFVIIFALSIPLFIQLKNGTFYQSPAQLRRRDQSPPYSTYNLYLVYLALVDLAYLLPFMAAEFCTLTPNVCSPHFWSQSMNLKDAHPPPQNSFDGLDIESVVAPPYAFANIWINAVITYEVWLLLKATHRGQRITQPSLMRVNLQAGGVIFGAMVYGVYQHYTASNHIHLSSAYIWISFTVWILLGPVPFFYVIGVTIFVKCRGYMPSVNGSSSPRDRAVRGLAVYFFRVVTVFLAIWIPNMVTGLLSGSSVIARHISFLLFALQPIITFWMILGKDDVKKYIKDFVTLTYLPKRCTCCRRDADASATTIEIDPEIAEEPSRRGKSVTILGYNFEDDDANENGEADDAIGDTFASANDDAEEEVDTEIHAVGDCDGASMVDEDESDEENDETEVDDENAGNPKYKSRRVREGPAAGVMAATGQAYRIPLRQEDQAEES